MIALFITLILLLAASVQTLLPFELPLLLSLLVVISFESDRAHSLYAALLAGLLHDALSPAPLGISIPLYILLVLGVRIIRDEIFSDQLVTSILLGALAGLFKTLYFTIIFSFGEIRPLGAGEVFLRLGGGFLSGAVILPVIFLLFVPVRHLLSADRYRRMV